MTKPYHVPINPTEKSPMQRHLDSQNNDPAHNMREAGEKVFEVNVLKGTGPYRAIVLKIDAQPLQPDPASYSAHVNSVFGNDPATTPPLVQIRARIPSLHAGSRPAPKAIDGPNADHFAIEAHPMFVALSTGVPAPQRVGEVVWVDFGNRETLEDPQYIRPMIEPAPVGGLGASTGCGFTGNGGSILNAKGPAGDLKTHENMPIGHVGQKLQVRYGTGRPKKGEPPKGKGLFIDRFPAIPKGHTPESLVKKCEWAGLGHVIFQVIAQAKSVGFEKGKSWTQSANKIKPYVDALMNRGIQVFLWGWPWMGAEVRGWNKNKPSEKGFCDFIVDIANEVGAVGVVTDPEANYQWSTKASRGFGWTGTETGKFTKEQVLAAASLHAKKLVGLAHAKGLSAGFTSYAVPAYHKTFPWKSFVDGKFDFAICQCYGGVPSPASYWKRAIEAYKSIGFSNVIGALGAYGAPFDGTVTQKWGKSFGGPEWNYGYGDPTKPPARMRYEATVHPFESNATTYWVWRHADRHISSWPETRWDVIRKLGNPSIKDNLAGKSTGGKNQEPAAATTQVSGTTPHATKQKQAPPPNSATSPSSGLAVTDGKNENIQTNDPAAINAKIKTLEEEKAKLVERKQGLDASNGTQQAQIEKLDKWIKEKDEKIAKLNAKLSSLGKENEAVAQTRKSLALAQKAYDDTKKTYEEEVKKSGTDSALAKVGQKELDLKAKQLETAKKEHSKALENFKNNPSNSQAPTNQAGSGTGQPCPTAGALGGSWDVGDINFNTAEIKSQKKCNARQKKKQIAEGSPQWIKKGQPGYSWKGATFGLTAQSKASGYSAHKNYWSSGGRGVAKRGKLSVNDGPSNRCAKHIHELGKAVEDFMCRPYKLGGAGLGPHGIQCSSFTRSVRVISMFGILNGNFPKEEYSKIMSGRIMDGVKRQGTGPKGSSSGLNAYEVPGIGGSNSAAPKLNGQNCSPWNGKNLMPGDCIMTGRYMQTHAAHFAKNRPCYISHVLIAYVGPDGNLWIAESGGPFHGVGVTPVNAKKAGWQKSKKMTAGSPNGAPAVYVYQPFEWTPSWQSIGGRPGGEWSPALWNKIKGKR